MSRSARSKEEDLSGANDDVPMGTISTGGISTEEDETLTGSNDDNSLGTTSTGNVSKEEEEEEDDVSIDGSFISEATFREDEDQHRVHPSTPWRGLSGVRHALYFGASSVVKRTSSFAKPLTTVGPILSKKSRSALTTAGRWFRGVKTNTKQRMASRKRNRERERRERQVKKRQRKRERREKQFREENQLFGPGWKRRAFISLIRHMCRKKNWKCTLGKRTKKRIGELVRGKKRPYVTTNTRGFIEATEVRLKTACSPF